MAVQRLVEIEYEHLDAGLMRSVGWIKESDDFVVLISQWMEGYDLCSYTVIPKGLVKNIVELGFE